MAKEKEKSAPKEEKRKPLIAKRDHTISHNGFELVIKEGDDLSKVPGAAPYFENLLTEKVL